MAAALVGGSILSAFLQVLFDKIASPQVVDFFKCRRLDDGLLHKLNSTMISVGGVLDDAEEQQITKPAVKNWLDELRDAVYQADDLLDEIAYEALRLELEAGSQTTIDQVKNFFSSVNPFKKGMEKKLGEMLDRLEYLVRQKDVLGLRESIGENPSSRRMPTTCLVDEFGVYGREDDKEAIMRFLLSDGSQLGVIPIVGMGGVGKTTLAQLVYNDSRVQQCFDSKAWVYVSEEFHVSRITKDIIEEVTRENCYARTLNQLQLELKESLMGKRFFIVLDDVWNDKHADWDTMQRPLKFGAQGSKIVVITRSNSVATVIQTPPIHHLKELTDDNCCFLFRKHAFCYENTSVPPDLEAIGREIVEGVKACL